MQTVARSTATVPAILLGIGLGGFVDGIVLHQILRWHNMLSARIPPTTLDAMHVNMVADGLFHAAVWIVTLAGVVLLWRAARRGPPRESGRQFAGGMLLGWGLFNLVEGVIDHHLLVLHNVREVAEPAAWNWGFLLVAGAGFLVAGGLMMRGRR